MVFMEMLWPSYMHMCSVRYTLVLLPTCGRREKNIATVCAWLLGRRPLNIFYLQVKQVVVVVFYFYSFIFFSYIRWCFIVYLNLFSIYLYIVLSTSFYYYILFWFDSWWLHSGSWMQKYTVQFDSIYANWTALRDFQNQKSTAFICSMAFSKMFLWVQSWISMNSIINSGLQC